MNFFRPKTTILPAAFVAWLTLFLVVPYANGFSEKDSQWLRICTQVGVQYVFVENTEDFDTEVFDQHECPCSSHFQVPNSAPLLPESLAHSVQHPSRLTPTPFSNPRSAHLSRGPPAFLAI